MGLDATDETLRQTPDGPGSRANGRKRTAILRDLGRLIAPLDVLYHVGNMIYRRSLRYTLFTVGISIIGIVARQFSLPGLTVRQAILLPLTIGALTLIGGYVMKAVPSLISSRLMNVAQACDLNLMEDYRKSEAQEHLEILWERLFEHECRLRLKTGRPPLKGLVRREGESDADALGRARTDFLARAHEALVTHMPQIRQMHVVGLDLRYLEDWRDGAYLDRSDTKLIEQFEGNSTLLDARRDVGLCGMAAMLRYRPRRFTQLFWFSFITRSLAMQVGTAVERLNRRFDTDLFNSQVLLWPGEEDAEWLRKFDAGRDAVLWWRRHVVRRVFGGDLRTAREVLDHMLYCCFSLATELRMRYDAEYCTGSLGFTVLDDLQPDGRERRDYQRAKGFVDRAAGRLEAFDEFLRARRGDLLAPANAEALRAVRTAVHVGRGGLGRSLARWQRDPSSPAAAEELARAVDRAAGNCEAISRRLVGVRMHHELTRLSRLGYRKLIAALGYEGADSCQ